MLDKLQRLFNLLLYLNGTTENMPIILVEPPHTSEAGEGARVFVSVERGEVGVADGEVAKGAFLTGKDEAVAGAVHGFEAVFAVGFFGFFRGCVAGAGDGVHVLGIVFEVARLGPEVFFVDEGGDYFFEAVADVLVAEEGDEAVEDAGARGEEEGGAGGVDGGGEEFLVEAEGSVVWGCFFWCWWWWWWCFLGWFVGWWGGGLAGSGGGSFTCRAASELELELELSGG